MDNAVKEEVIEWISKPENEELLEILKLIKDASSEDWFDNLSKSEKKSISKGKSDFSKGNTLSSKEFWKQHD
ncbi:hypothetical protein [Fodinibius sp.]|uniref:hypothetical protein n=1 Tax=Fodinibius sp. TaxID=1872440 RepID=UPI002ACDCB90|nr:hypothetical protein [Fodinibius sp.]MDZ7658648.1 hypothetical protein [Fodinibius sp.]